VSSHSHNAAVGKKGGAAQCSSPLRRKRKRGTFSKLARKNLFYEGKKKEFLTLTGGGGWALSLSLGGEESRLPSHGRWTVLLFSWGGQEGGERRIPLTAREKNIKRIRFRSCVQEKKKLPTGTAESGSVNSAEERGGKGKGGTTALARKKNGACSSLRMKGEEAQISSVKRGGEKAIQPFPHLGGRTILIMPPTGARGDKKSGSTYPFA